MRKSCLLAPLLLPLLAWAQTIEIQANRDTYCYACGEPATFRLCVRDAQGACINTGKLQVTLNNFGSTQMSNLIFDLSQATTVTSVGTLNEPGFLKCNALFKADKTYTATCAVAYDPEKIKPGSTRPADFDAFWDDAIKKLDAEVPLDPRVERLDAYSNERHTAYRVSFATFDQMRVYGFLSVPQDKAKGPFPAEVNVPGAGPGVVRPSTGMADQGFIHLVMNVHPFEPAATPEEQKRLYNEQDERLKAQYHAPRYCQSGATNRETYFYYRIALGINRAVNWLAARPDVDKTRFCYTGTSQGGGFGFILCGLNPHFTKGVFHVPALTDLLGYQSGRDSGWPKLIENLPEVDRVAARQVVPYFDGAHFAPRITCPVRVTVGFIDTTCPPAAVYSGYNALSSKDKAIGHGIGMTHGVFPKFYKRFDHEWVRTK